MVRKVNKKLIFTDLLKIFLMILVGIFMIIHLTLTQRKKESKNNKKGLQKFLIDLANNKMTHFQVQI